MRHPFSGIAKKGPFVDGPPEGAEVCLLTCWVVADKSQGSTQKGGGG